MTTAEPPVQQFHTPRDVRRGVVAGVVVNMAPNSLTMELEARATP